MLRIERRKAPRMPFFAEVQVAGRDETYFHPTANLSMGGVFLCTEFPLSVSTRLVVIFKTADGLGSFSVVGRVAWCQKGTGVPGSGDDGHPIVRPGMGVSFESLGEVESRCLSDLMASLVFDETGWRPDDGPGGGDGCSRDGDRDFMRSCFRAGPQVTAPGYPRP